MMDQSAQNSRSIFWLILITGLGFFVDSYDAFSYNVMRMPSLTELGLSGDALTQAGIFILNCQVLGTLVGGFAFGLLGDRIGRKKALLGSILIYSIGMCASAFVHTVEAYALVRFFTGFGIAGEVGLGATLVGEMLPKNRRVIGLALFTAMGLLGVTTAALSVEFFHWRHAYLAGGVAGLLVLALRHFLLESRLFLQTAQNVSFLTPLKEIFTSGRHIKRYIACIFLLAPNFFVTGVLLTLSPEVAKSLGVPDPLKANIILAAYFVMAVLGDLIGATLTHVLQSRRHAIAMFMVGNLIGTMALLYSFTHPTLNQLYMCGAAIGLFNLWALSATVSVEQFPTHLRATVSTSVLNFARAMIIVFNLSFLALKPNLGTIDALALVGCSVLGIGFLSALLMRETYHVDLEQVAD